MRVRSISLAGALALAACAAAQEPPPAVRTTEPVQQGERRLVIEKTVQTPLVQVAYKSPAAADPRGKALEANTRNVKRLEHAKRVMAEKAKKERSEFEALAKKVSAVSLTITAQVGKDDKMFGSVTAKDLAERVAEHGFAIDRRKIVNQFMEDNAL